MTSFLITGAAGFIGYHLSRRLLAQGHKVTGFDGMTSYYDIQLKRARVAMLDEFDEFRLVEAMLDDRPALQKAAEMASPEIIIHLAAQAGVRYSLEQPQTYIASNLVGSWHVLELARELQPAHLLMASTSSVYGANAKIPFCERDRADEPLSLYAATKKGMEALAHSYSALFDIPATMFRFFTVYGPWGRPDMALFKFVEAIEQGHPIDVYGQGAMARDFTYVDDLVDAIVRLAPLAPQVGAPTASRCPSLSTCAPFRTLNIGGGQPVGLMEFIATIEQCLGRKAVLNMLDMQPGDVPRTFADPSLLRDLIGYVPATSVREGVDAFVEWYRAYYAPARQRPATRAA
jgi:UDP-glucuronate 4-epimerase